MFTALTGCLSAPFDHDLIAAIERVRYVIPSLGKCIVRSGCHYLLDNVRQSRTTVPAEKLVPARRDTHLGIHTVQSARQDVLVRDGTPKHLGILHHFHARVRKHSGSRRTKRSPGHHGYRQDDGEDQRSSNHRQGIWDERQIGVMAKRGGETTGSAPFYNLDVCDQTLRYTEVLGLAVYVQNRYSWGTRTSRTSIFSR